MGDGRAKIPRSSRIKARLGFLGWHCRRLRRNWIERDRRKGKPFSSMRDEVEAAQEEIDELGVTLHG